MNAFAAALAGTALSGLLYAAAFPPLSWSAFGWIALVPFFLALRQVGWKAGLFLGWFWAVFASAFVASALPEAVETYFLQPKGVSLGFAVLVWTVTGSVYTMGFARVQQAIGRRSAPFAGPLLSGAAWAFFELLRGRLWTGSELFTGNPWALIAYGQVGSDALMQTASLAGPYGVSFLLATCAAGVAEAGVALARGRRFALAALRPLVAPGVVGLAALGFGTARLAQADEAPPPSVGVAAVQGNLDLGSGWKSSHYGRNLRTYLELTHAALAEAPSLVVWPESALTFFLEDEPGYRRAIGAVLAPHAVELVVGGPRRAEGEAGAPRYLNSVFALDRRGEIRARYDKEHLVPFAEYFPLRAIDPLQRSFEQVRSFSHGEPGPPLPTTAGALGILTCNEAMLPEVAAARVRSGATLLVAPSNDTWIQDERWADMMFDLVSVRAIEQGRWLVRASTSGPSAVVDPWGRVQGRTGPFTRAVLHGRVAALEERTVYARLGDAPTLLGALGVALFLVVRKPEATTDPGTPRSPHTSPTA